MALTKEDLEIKVIEKRIQLEEGVKWTNDKLVKRLGDYTLEHTMKGNRSWGVDYLQSLETVQLCRHLKDEQKAFDKAGVNPMESPDYIAEFKENGARVFVYYDPWSGFKFFSRRESVFNFLNNDLTDKVLLIENGIISSPSDYIGKYNYRFVLDGEITVDSEVAYFEGVSYLDIEDLMQAIIGSLPERAKQFQKEGNRFIFNIFDCIFFEKDPVQYPPEVHYDYYATDKELTKEEIDWVEGTFKNYLETACFKGYKSAKKLYAYLYSLHNTVKGDIRKYPFLKRRELRRKLVNFLQSKNLPFVEVEGEDVNKMDYLEQVLDAHYEGIILKNIHAPYISGMKSSRSHRACMKVKQSINQLMNDKDTNMDFDVFITGINPPKSKRIKDMIGSLNCSIYINDNGETYEHEIASVSGIPHEWKRELCAFDENGNMVLNPEYYGKVIAINGLALTYNLKFQHAVLFNKQGLVIKDKNPTDCVWDKAALEQMVITRGNASVRTSQA